MVPSYVATLTLLGFYIAIFLYLVALWQFLSGTNEKSSATSPVVEPLPLNSSAPLSLVTLKVTPRRKVARPSKADHHVEPAECSARAEPLCNSVDTQSKAVKSSTAQEPLCGVDDQQVPVDAKESTLEPGKVLLWSFTLPKARRQQRQETFESLIRKGGSDARKFRLRNRFVPPPPAANFKAVQECQDNVANTTAEDGSNSSGDKSEFESVEPTTLEPCSSKVQENSDASEREVPEVMKPGLEARTTNPLDTTAIPTTSTANTAPTPRRVTKPKKLTKSLATRAPLTTRTDTISHTRTIVNRIIRSPWMLADVIIARRIASWSPSTTLTRNRVHLVAPPPRHSQRLHNNATEERYLNGTVRWNPYSTISKQRVPAHSEYQTEILPSFPESLPPYMPCVPSIAADCTNYSTVHGYTDIESRAMNLVPMESTVEPSGTGNIEQAYEYDEDVTARLQRSIAKGKGRAVEDYNIHPIDEHTSFLIPLVEDVGMIEGIEQTIGVDLQSDMENSRQSYPNCHHHHHLSIEPIITNPTDVRMDRGDDIMEQPAQCSVRDTATMANDRAEAKRETPAVDPRPRPTYYRPEIPTVDPRPRPTYCQPEIPTVDPRPRPTYVAKPRVETQLHTATKQDSSNGPDGETTLAAVSEEEVDAHIAAAVANAKVNMCVNTPLEASAPVSENEDDLPDYDEQEHDDGLPDYDEQEHDDGLDYNSRERIIFGLNDSEDGEDTDPIEEMEKPRDEDKGEDIVVEPRRSRDNNMGLENLDVGPPSPQDDIIGEVPTVEFHLPNSNDYRYDSVIESSTLPARRRQAQKEKATRGPVPYSTSWAHERRHENDVTIAELFEGCKWGTDPDGTNKYGWRRRGRRHLFWI